MAYNLAKLPPHLQSFVKNILKQGNISNEEWIFYLKQYKENKDINAKIEIMKFSRYYILNELLLMDYDFTDVFEEAFRYGEMGVTRALNLLNENNYLEGSKYLIDNIRAGISLFLQRMGE